MMKQPQFLAATNQQQAVTTNIHQHIFNHHHHPHPLHQGATVIHGRMLFSNTNSTTNNPANNSNNANGCAGNATNNNNSDASNNHIMQQANHLVHSQNDQQQQQVHGHQNQNQQHQYQHHQQYHQQQQQQQHQHPQIQHQHLQHPHQHQPQHHLQHQQHQQQQQQQQHLHNQQEQPLNHNTSNITPMDNANGPTSLGVASQRSANFTNATHQQLKKEPPANGKKTKGRVRIEMKFIQNKLRRYTTFSKRKTGIMKKAFELHTLTGTQVMLLVASETGHVYTYTTDKFETMVKSEAGKALIQTCLDSPDFGTSADSSTNDCDTNQNSINSTHQLGPTSQLNQHHHHHLHHETRLINNNSLAAGQDHELDEDDEDQDLDLIDQDQDLDDSQHQRLNQTHIGADCVDLKSSLFSTASTATSGPHLSVASSSSSSSTVPNSTHLGPTPTSTTTSNASANANVTSTPTKTTTAVASMMQLGHGSNSSSLDTFSLLHETNVEDSAESSSAQSSLVEVPADCNSSFFSDFASHHQDQNNHHNHHGHQHQHQHHEHQQQQRQQGQQQQHHHQLHHNASRSQVLHHQHQLVAGNRLANPVAPTSTSTSTTPSHQHHQQQQTQNSNNNNNNNQFIVDTTIQSQLSSMAQVLSDSDSLEDQINMLSSSDLYLSESDVGELSNKFI